jgi:hypothetical protein
MHRKLDSALIRCRAGLLAGGLAAALLASCATVDTIPPDSHLGGHWVIDPSASDDAGARVALAIAEFRKKLRARRPGGATDGGNGPGGGGPGGGGPGGGGPGGGGPGGGRRGSGVPGPAPEPEPAPASAPRGDGTDDAPESIIDQYGNTRQLGPDFRTLSASLLHAISSPHELEIDVDGDALRVVADRLPARDYRLGEGFSRFDEYGTARMQPTWTDNAFVLRARYTNGASILERYQVLPGQNALTRTVNLIDPILGKLQLRSTYRRAPP